MESGLFDDGDLQKIKATFAKIVNVKLRTIPLSLNCEPRYIKRKPSSGAKERFMRMVEMPIVPFDLPSSNIRGPKASGMKPVPVIQSPSRPVKVNNIQDWKIPPSISKWKNSRGTLCCYETKLHNEIMVKEKERRDQELRALAQRARPLVQDEQLINIPKTDRFRPDKVFAGTFERATQGDKPVLEFDTDAQNSDLLGMDELWK
uniref:SKI-interacting protein SKIP SNW domain-containing protein n=1 Tax=Populus trichocarpa TaxID=3694 RepID=B9GIP2_POPTR|eukprot:XP_002298797.2 SNW/SKI-interacting protein A [Populus trichocarpa]